MYLFLNTGILLSNVVVLRENTVNSCAGKKDQNECPPSRFSSGMFLRKMGQGARPAEWDQNHTLPELCTSSEVGACLPNIL